MKTLSQQEIYEAFDRALKKVAADYEAGTLDMSGRYWSDEELATMRAARGNGPGSAVKPDSAA